MRKRNKKTATKKRSAKTRKIRTVKLTPDTAVKIAVPKGAVPSVITDPVSGTVHVIPIPAEKIADQGWFRRWFM